MTEHGHVGIVNSVDADAGRAVVSVGGFLVDVALYVAAGGQDSQEIRPGDRIALMPTTASGDLVGIGVAGSHGPRVVASRDATGSKVAGLSMGDDGAVALTNSAGAELLFGDDGSVTLRSVGGAELVLGADGTITLSGGLGGTLQMGVLGTALDDLLVALHVHTAPSGVTGSPEAPP